VVVWVGREGLEAESFARRRSGTRRGGRRRRKGRKGRRRKRTPHPMKVLCHV